ncbi:MAG: antibiotic biosynthesis monooxygenase, partial [Bacillati bacterium ANGP1]
MIARIWKAETTPAGAPGYAEHLRARVVPALRQVDGYAGAMLLERSSAGGVEVVVITLWRSLEAIRGFAGADLENAVV